MEHNQMIAGVLVNDDSTTITYTQVCRMHNIPENELNDLLEYGLFRQVTTSITQTSFNQDMLNRIHSARRLQSDLGVNSPGVVLILELRDELDELRNQLAILRRHVDVA